MKFKTCYWCGRKYRKSRKRKVQCIFCGGRFSKDHK